MSEVGQPGQFEPFFFDPEKLAALAHQHGESYRTTKPFPHVAIDDFLPEKVLDRVVEEFPGPGDDTWAEFSGYGWRDGESQEFEEPEDGQYRVLGKLGQTNTGRMGPHTRQLFAEINSSRFVRFLEQLTGIDKLIPDPHLIGAGLHSTGRGGRLRVHADFMWNPKIKLHRRVNALIYLNRDWREEYGGELDLWDRDVTRAEARILPVFNRLAVFTTTSTSWHGQTNPVACPPGQRRDSMIFFFYTAERPEGEVEKWHGTHTLWARTPGEPSGFTGIGRYVPPLALDFARYLRWRFSWKKLLPPLFSGR